MDASNRVLIDGRIPVNPHGGALSEGGYPGIGSHPRSGPPAPGRRGRPAGRRRRAGDRDRGWLLLQRPGLEPARPTGDGHTTNSEGAAMTGTHTMSFDPITIEEAGVDPARLDVFLRRVRLEVEHGPLPRRRWPSPVTVGSWPSRPTATPTPSATSCSRSGARSWPPRCGSCSATVCSPSTNGSATSSPSSPPTGRRS